MARGHTNNNHSNTFGVWLRELQDRLDLTDTHLASMLNVTAPAITKWKYGGSTPSKPEYLDKLVELSGEDRATVYALAGRGYAGVDVAELDRFYVDVALGLQKGERAIQAEAYKKLYRERLRRVIQGLGDEFEMHRDALAELDAAVLKLIDGEKP